MDSTSTSEITSQSVSSVEVIANSTAIHSENNSNVNGVYVNRPGNNNNTNTNNNNNSIPAHNSSVSMSATNTTIRKSAPQRKELFSKFGLASIIYAIFYTFCLFENHNGVTFPFFVAGTIFYLIYCMNKFNPSEDKKKWIKSGNLFYVVSVMLLGLSVFLTTDLSCIVISKVGIGLLIISFLLHNTYDDSKWNFPKYLLSIGNFLINIFENLNTPFGDMILYSKSKKNKTTDNADEKPKKTSNLIYVLLGFLVAIPLVCIVVALLCKADVVFKETVDSFIEFINLKNIVLWIIMSVAVYMVAFSAVVGLSKKSINIPDTKEPNFEPVLGITITSIISVFYLLFSGIQIGYLFIGNLKLPEGYTYAEYAKTGFYELLAVCVINLVLVLLFAAIFKRSKVLNIILAIVCACTYIMIASSGLRMYIYVCAYNLTEERIFTYVALVTIAILMAGLLIYIFNRNFKLFKFCMITLTCLSIAYVYSHPDYWIARYNLSHYGQKYDAFEEDGTIYIELDADYLVTKLCDDAAPVLLNSNNLSVIYENVNSQSKMRKFLGKYDDMNTEGMTFRTFNVSKLIANIAYENSDAPKLLKKLNGDKNKNDDDYDFDNDDNYRYDDDDLYEYYGF